MNNNRNLIVSNHFSGFTLIEMAIVLVIIGLLVSAFLSPISTQRDIRNRASTQKQLLEIKAALFGYAVVNGHLPCPDTKSLPDGEESRSGNTCSSDSGVLPWNSLGLSRTDAWDHYFTYRVDSTFSASNPLFSIADAEGNSGITIHGFNNADLVSTNSRPAAIVLSHGANGFGAINTNQNAGTNVEPAPTNTDELENTDGDVTFVSHPPTAAGFDDLLIWLSPKVLIHHMVTAERLP